MWVQWDWPPADPDGGVPVDGASADPDPDAGGFDVEAEPDEEPVELDEGDPLSVAALAAAARPVTSAATMAAPARVCRRRIFISFTSPRVFVGHCVRVLSDFSSRALPPGATDPVHRSR